MSVDKLAELSSAIEKEIRDKRSQVTALETQIQALQLTKAELESACADLMKKRKELEGEYDYRKMAKLFCQHVEETYDKIGEHLANAARPFEKL